MPAIIKNRKSLNTLDTNAKITDEIIEKLKVISLSQATDLVTEIQKIFKVDTSPPAYANFQQFESETKISNEQQAPQATVFNVVLQQVPDEKRVAILKVIRNLTSLGLKEAKEFTTELPKILKNAVSKQQAEDAQEQLQQAGATVKIE